MSNKEKVKPANRSKKCGFRIRGKNHENGTHHNNGNEGRSGKVRRY